MQGKITLITPPDIFENENKSILFMHLNESDQETVSNWFAKSSIDENVNIYFYDQEVDLPWLFYAIGRCDHVFFDIDGCNNITQHLSSYILGKKKSVFKVESDSTAAIYYFINQNRITNIELLLEQVFNDKDGSKT
jgi:hypothetical protein